MRTSRSITASLLSGYAFLDHVFTFNSYIAAVVRRSLAFYARHSMRITCLSLPEVWDESLVDAKSGMSELPASLLALTFGRIECEARGAARCARCLRWQC